MGVREKWAFFDYQSGNSQGILIYVFIMNPVVTMFQSEEFLWEFFFSCINEEGWNIFQPSLCWLVINWFLI